MLVLTRKPGESIIIAGNIKVTVLQVAKGQIRLGFEAPQSVSIVRAELEEVRLDRPAQSGAEDTQTRPKTMMDIT